MLARAVAARALHASQVAGAPLRFAQAAARSRMPPPHSLVASFFAVKHAKGRPSAALCRFHSALSSAATSSGGDRTDDKDDEPVAKQRFGVALPADMEERLQKRGFETLFPIQLGTYDAIFLGRDVLARARTGTGKTLAFVLPTICRLQLLRVQSGDSTHHRSFGERPKVLVMAPTRELAKQVFDEFDKHAASGVSSCCVYGGVGYEPQVQALKRGVDVVVGTPGRIMDLMDKGVLKLDNVMHVILDEADRMLEVGFAEDVDKIMKKVQLAASEKPQVTLFSATIPAFVKQTMKKFMSPDHVVVDQLDGEVNKTSEWIKHLTMPCLSRDYATLIPEVIRQYAGPSGKTIVFTSTKLLADQLAEQIGKHGVSCVALHGDHSQNRREQTMDRFRQGRCRCLLATDVAARGLDVSDVSLVIQVEPPDFETYIHRSGRTGRAGQPGTSVCLFDSKTAEQLLTIQRRAGIKFETVQLGSPAEQLQRSMDTMERLVSRVSPWTASMFLSRAQELLEKDNNPVQLLAAYMATASGHATKSLQTGKAKMVTFQLTAPPAVLRSPFQASRFLLSLSESASASSQLQVSADNSLIIFDMPEQVALKFQEDVQQHSGRAKVEICQQLPKEFAQRMLQSPPAKGRDKANKKKGFSSSAFNSGHGQQSGQRNKKGPGKSGKPRPPRSSAQDSARQRSGAKGSGPGKQRRSP